MLKAGLGPISIRLRSELAVEAWHWNPKGSWSDSQHCRGYWTSNANPESGSPILLSYGYRLPRRGNTLDEANDDGYSMIDDGKTSTFWKSNPYLTRHFTGEADSTHPQWVVLDFGKLIPVNSIKIQWGEPFARRFSVEYAQKGRVYFGGHPWGVWHHFPNGTITDGCGGDQVLNLSSRPVMARYIRVWMTEGSGTSLSGSRDRRDSMGYAIREISAGEYCRSTSKAGYAFIDHVVHAPGKGQTIVYVSSTDPWHREGDRDPKVEQPGIDLLEECGITRGLPIMTALPVLYDTPQNAAALADYVHRSGYPVNRTELGEEPDGQRVDPRDFGALYAQTALEARKVAPEIIMGGPSFVTVDVDGRDDKTYRFDKRWWIRDFLSELKRRGQIRDFRFLSFEWYPFDDVDGPETAQLPVAREMLSKALRLLRRPGMPRVPLIIGEFNYSVFPCRQEVDLAGALLNAETAAQFLCSGGEAAYYYGYEPNTLDGSSGSWGNQLMLLRRQNGIVPVATFHAMRLLSTEWLDPTGGIHGVLKTRTNLAAHDRKLFDAFTLMRPDKSCSLLFINKDPAHAVSLTFGHRKNCPFDGSCRLVTYSPKEYKWRADGANGCPALSEPPSTKMVSTLKPIRIPPWSIGVLRSGLSEHE